MRAGSRCRPGRRLSCSGACRGGRRRRRAVGQPGASPGRAQGRRGARHRALPARQAALRRGARSPTCTIRRATCSGSKRRSTREWQLTRPAMRPRGAAAAAGAAAQGRMESHRRGARRVADHRRLAGLPRRVVRHGRRRRLDDDRRAPLRSRERRSRGIGGTHESADPLRRGPDEPRVLRDDESGRRRADDGGRARRRISELAAEVARSAGIAPEAILEATLVGNPIMHHLVLGIDPVELGGAPFALAIDRAVTRDGCRDRHRAAPERAGLRAALHCRARRRGHRGHDSRRAARPRRRA